MKYTLTTPACEQAKRFVYTEMARLGLSQDQLISASVAQWDIFTTILVFEVPDGEQITQAVMMSKARPRYEAKNAAGIEPDEQGRHTGLSHDALAQAE